MTFGQNYNINYLNIYFDLMICLFIFYVVPTQENFAMIVNSQYSYNNIVANLGNR